MKIWELAFDVNGDFTIDGKQGERIVEFYPTLKEARANKPACDYTIRSIDMGKNKLELCITLNSEFGS